MLKLAHAAAAVFSLILIAGCNQTFTGGPSAETATENAKAAEIPRPRPTPTPDPLQKFRALQQVPTWAQQRTVNDVPIKPGEKLFALTFDDGPWPESTEQILKILDKYDAKGTFYMVGQMVRAHPKIAQKVRDGGHSIGNHSWSHPSRPRNAVEEVQKADAEIKKAVGVLPSTFRPPYGILKNGLARQANRQKMPVIIWSADSNDWRRPSAERIANNVIRQAHPGGIALLHDGGGERSRTVRAVPIIIRELQARGYRLVTVPELLKARYIAPPKPKPTPTQPPPAASKSKAPRQKKP